MTVNGRKKSVVGKCYSQKMTSCPHNMDNNQSSTEEIRMIRSEPGPDYSLSEPSAQIVHSQAHETPFENDYLKTDIDIIKEEVSLIGCSNIKIEDLLFLNKDHQGPLSSNEVGCSSTSLGQITIKNEEIDLGETVSEDCNFDNIDNEVSDIKKLLLPMKSENIPQANDKGNVEKDEEMTKRIDDASTRCVDPVNNEDKVKCEPPKEVDLNFQINNAFTSIGATDFDISDDRDQVAAKNDLAFSPPKSLPEANVGTTLHNSPNDAENARDFAEKNAEDEGEMKSDENISTTNCVPVNNGNKIKSEPPQEVDLSFQINNVLTSIEATEFDNSDDEEQLPAKKKFRSSPGERYDWCRNCRKGFGRSANSLSPGLCKECGLFLRHVTAQHAMEQPYACNICRKRFGTQSILLVHMRTHTKEKPYKCQVCEKTFSQSSQVTKHMRTHNNEKPYKCEVCGKNFSESANVTKHMRTHTNEKPFKCPVCERMFSTSVCVKRHMRTHTNEKPFKCPVCERMFSISASAKRHMLTHTMEKPYKCKICEKPFQSSSQVTRHMRTHSNEKPYKCQVCEKAFSDSSALSRHTSIHQRWSIRKHVRDYGR